MKSLKIGNLTASIPLIQGGMGVGVSLSNLAGAVAKEGGIGIISTAQIGYRKEGFDKNPIEKNIEAIGEELKKAREISGGNGLVGFNIMVATRGYEEYAKEAAKCGADVIICGAGLPIELPRFVEGTNTKIAPIVSSARSASVICRMWDKKYQVAPDFVVIEGPKAGGHLGFSLEDIEKYETQSYDDEIRKIIAEVKKFADKYQKEIPVIVAGGIYDRNDLKHAIELGASGVQVATRFVTTKECDVSEEFKNAYINAKKEDIVIVKSPVGMPGRAILNKFMEETKSGKKLMPKVCYKCLSKCEPAKIPYCITEALVNAAKGDVDNALLFCGENAYKSQKIETVREVLEDFFDL